jgi:hypothetical protein
MSEAKQVPTSSPEPAVDDAATARASTEKESGRVAFDARGNPVWEWRSGDGQFQRDASTSLVRKLEAPELSLEPTVVVRQPENEALSKAKLACGGFDPYDTGPADAKPAGRPAPTPRPVRPAVDPPARQPGLLERLQTWVGGKGPARMR